MLCAVTVATKFPHRDAFVLLLTDRLQYKIPENEAEKTSSASIPKKKIFLPYIVGFLATKCFIDVCIDIEPAIQHIRPVFRLPVGRLRLIHYAKVNSLTSTCIPIFGF
jgi:hypothetical protein